MMRTILWVVLLVVALGSPVLHAQGKPFGTVQLGISQSYDDNLFTTTKARGPQPDWISRVGPTFEGGYVAPTLTFIGQYGFEAERYLTHTALNDNFARQDGHLNFRYRPTPRLSLRTDALYLDTKNPRELNQLTSLITLGRARAQRIQAQSGAVYTANAVMKVNADYTYTDDMFVGALRSRSQLARLGVEWKPSPRNGYRFDYRFRHVGFTDGNGVFRDIGFNDGDGVFFATLTAGWLHEFTPSTGFEVDAGPRIRQGAMRPELSALLRHRLRRGEMSLLYTSTEDTTLGEVSTIELQRLMATLSFTPVRDLTLSATPTIARSTIDALHTVVQAIDGGVTVRATPRISIVATGRVGRQTGILNNGVLVLPGDDLISTRGFTLKSIVTLGERHDDRVDAR